MTQGLESAGQIYTLAVQKLQASIQFARGDIAPYNALGDAHVGWAEHMPDIEAMQQLELAVSQGYQAALHVNAASNEALIGIAEVKSKMGKLCQRNGASEALKHFQKGAQAYQRALQTPANLGNLQERNEIKYNFACLLCLTAQYDTALTILSELLRQHGVTVHDLTTDEDLVSMRELPAFQHLIQQAHASMTVI